MNLTYPFYWLNRDLRTLGDDLSDRFSKFRRDPFFWACQSWCFCIKMCVFYGFLRVGTTCNLRGGLKMCGMGSPNMDPKRTPQLGLLLCASWPFFHENTAKKWSTPCIPRTASKYSMVFPLYSLVFHIEYSRIFQGIPKVFQGNPKVFQGIPRVFQGHSNGSTRYSTKIFRHGIYSSYRSFRS